MGTSRLSERRPRLALPFTMLRAADRVRLVAGEDLRYELTGAGVEQWAPDFLTHLAGRRGLDEIVGELDQRWRAAAVELVERLYGERVLVDGIAEDVHRAARFAIAVTGSGELRRRVEAGHPPAAATDGTVLRILCQDRLDYAEVLRFNRRCLREGDAWLWATSGPLSRAFVSPVVRQNGGPCLACLVRHFERLSPAPEIYADLVAHAESDGVIEPVPFPEDGTTILAALVAWKIAHLADVQPQAAVYRLHVLELATMEVSVHPVPLDPECAACAVRT